jgi:hypothetical protein
MRDFVIDGLQMTVRLIFLLNINQQLSRQGADLFMAQFFKVQLGFHDNHCARKALWFRYTQRDIDP